MTLDRKPAVWLPTIRAGTGADVFAVRLRDGLEARGIRAEIAWLPHQAEYLPWAVHAPEPPAWANVAHVNSWLPRRFWPRRLPTVVTVHHLVHDPAYRPFRSVPQAAYHALLIRPRELRAIRDAGVVTVVSDYVKRTVAEFSGREQITVIHNWVDGEVFVPGDGSAGHGGGPFRLFMAGSHSRRKGFDLLPAFARALGPGFEIRYAGGKSKPMPHIPNVIELGRISDAQLIREYQACDAVVSLSRYEGFGYTALEAIACGKAFLGFHTSALPEVVAQGDGVLVPLADVKALAAAAHELQAQAGRDGTGATAGRNRILQRFSAANLDRYVDAYARLIEQGPDARGSRDG